MLAWVSKILDDVDGHVSGGGLATCGVQPGGDGAVVMWMRGLIKAPGADALPGPGERLVRGGAGHRGVVAHAVRVFSTVLPTAVAKHAAGDGVHMVAPAVRGVHAGAPFRPLVRGG